MAYNESTAYAHAIQLVQAALASGTLKLEAATAHGNNSKHIEANLEHINGLIDGIAKNLLKSSG